MLLANIAITQVRAGDFQGAWETQDYLPESQRASTLSAIAWAQAEIGDLAAASRTAAAIQDARVKATALSNLVAAHANRRDFQGALAIAAGIDAHPDSRLRAYQLIAHFQLRAGDKPAAARTLRDVFNWAKRELTDSENHFTVVRFTSIALAQSRVGDVAGAAETREHLKQILNQMPDTGTKESALGSAARAFAADGESLLAREMIARMKPGSARDRALAHVAIVETQAGNDPAAQESIRGIETPSEAAFAREQVGSLQATRGDTPGALETAGAIPDPARRAKALITIAVAQANKRQAGSASVTMARALEAAALAGPEQMDAEFFRQVAEVQVLTGDVLSAQQTVRTIQDEKHRARASWMVTHEQAATEAWRLALTWAEEETSLLVRAYALLGVADGILVRLAQVNSAK